MKTRHYFLIIICFLFVTCAGGIYFRTTLSPLDWDSVKECARVGILQDEIAVDTIENMATSLENQNVILAVECLEEPHILYKNIIQKVRVKKCFQGTVEEGAEIHILQVNNIYLSDDNGMIKSGQIQDINMSFTNVFSVGKTYLVFLDEEIENYPVAHTYCKGDDYLMKPFFCYEELTCSPEDSSFGGVKYERVAQNEFFLEEQGLGAMLELKQQLLLSYPLQ